MLLSEVEGLLSKIKGATFASIDSETKPAPGYRKICHGEQVILFTNKKSSGYNNMVRRRLQAAGKNPDSFVLGDLPWGERIVGTPLIVHNGQYYLQTILLAEGEAQAFIGKHPIPLSSLPNAGKQHYAAVAQGLPDAAAVQVRTYKLDSLTAIRMFGETIPKA